MTLFYKFIVFTFDVVTSLTVHVTPDNCDDCIVKGVVKEITCLGFLSTTYPQREARDI